MATVSNKDYQKIIVTPFIDGKNLPTLRIRNLFQVLDEPNCQTLLKRLANKPEGNFSLHELISLFDLMPRRIGKQPFSKEKVYQDFRRLSRIGVVKLIVYHRMRNHFSLNRETIKIYAELLTKRFSHPRYLDGPNKLIFEYNGQQVFLYFDLINRINNSIIALQDPEKRKILKILNSTELPEQLFDKSIAEKTNLTKEAISRHFIGFDKSGIIKKDKKGRNNYRSLDYEFLFNLFQLLQDFKTQISPGGR